MEKLFGTDGVRGVANKHPMTAEIALKLGRASAHVLNIHSEKTKVVIGKDTRLSSYMFEHALSAGFCSMGVDVLLVGPIPTPAIAFLTQTMKCGAGVIISASHNLFQDNGIKFFSKSGFKLDDATEAEIEQHVFNNHLDSYRPTADHVGKIKRIDDAQGRYIEFAKRSVPPSLSLSGLKIVVDCANGATYQVAPPALIELGAEVISTSVSPNGVNINEKCGSTYVENISDLVVSNNAHIGISFDGDGDRTLFVDEKGVVVDGDEILAICAKDMIGRNELKKYTVVGTVMSNVGLERAIKEMGAKLIRTQVGDRYVVEALRQGGFSLGGEPSGHLLFLDRHTTGDGLISALQVLNIMQSTGKPLSELKKVITRFPQVLKNMGVKNKIPLSEVPGLENELRQIRRTLGDSGRILVRYSGTEKMVRVMLEGEDIDQITGFANTVVDIFSKNNI